MTDRYRRLEEFYAQYDAATERRDCGTCFACCRAGGRASHSVSELELRLLERRVGPQHHFRGYLAGETRADGSLRYEVCPHYDKGCQVYAWRPFSCRTFGQWREMGSLLPPECVYEGVSQTVSRRELDRVVPGAAGVKGLILELRAEQPAGAAAVGELRAAGDPLDVALRFARKGEAEAARAELARALELYARHPFILSNAGLIYATLKDHATALEVFMEACTGEPTAENHYYAATQALALEENQLALGYAERAHELDPTHFRTLGLLGGLYCRAERWADAIRVLEPACERPDLHGTNTAYLAFAREKLSSS